jgi:MFS-type transporter involved in bile tolerance (Atg22 family)
MNSLEIAYAALILLASNLPGSLLAKWVCLRFNPLFSYRASLFYFLSSIAAAAVVLTGPERKKWAYFFAAMWGIGMGVLFPSQRVLFCTLIPKKQETELMGVFVFAAEIIGWLPSVVFTLMNQQNVDMRWSLSIVAFFVGFAFLCTLPMGGYKGALQQVAVEPEQLATGKMCAEISTSPEAASKIRSEDIPTVDDEECKC